MLIKCVAVLSEQPQRGSARTGREPQKTGNRARNGDRLAGGMGRAHLAALEHGDLVRCPGHPGGPRSQGFMRRAVLAEAGAHLQHLVEGGRITLAADEEADEAAAGSADRHDQPEIFTLTP